MSDKVTEDSAIGSTLFALSVYDEDGGTGHSFTTSFSPAAGAEFFTIQTSDSSHYVTLTAKLDYVSQVRWEDVTPLSFFDYVEI